MCDNMQENKNGEEKREVTKVLFPVIPASSWFESEKHTIDTSATDPLLDDKHVAINAYSLMRHFGHKDYMSREEAIAMATALLKLLAPEKLATK